MRFSFQATCLVLGLLLCLPMTACQSTGSTTADGREEVFVFGNNKKKGSKKSKKGKKSTEVAEAETPRPAPATGPLGSKNSYSSVGTNLPLLALTFDDGPHPENTPRLLDLLKSRNVKATFYVVGTNAKRYPGLLRRMVAEGHEIGNHTITHGNLTKMTPDAVRHELKVSHETIVAATGVAPRSMRPPYGAITSEQKAWIKQEFGYPAVLWSVDPEDWKRPGSAVVANRLVSGARPGGILLVHDIHKPSIDAMPSAIDQLLGKGFQFITVSQLIAMDGKG